MIAPAIVIEALVGLFRAGYEIKEIMQTENPETEEQYRARIRELLNVPTVDELRDKYGKKDGE